jgi:hypothetical protein
VTDTGFGTTSTTGVALAARRTAAVPAAGAPFITAVTTPGTPITRANETAEKPLRRANLAGKWSLRFMPLAFDPV